jgi:p-aminobenzoyl-glutamate transporter AbgT
VSALLTGAWEFVVGDDWRLALGVVLLLGLTAILAAIGIAAWWVAPVLVPLLLLVSIRRALRRPRVLR